MLIEDSGIKSRKNRKYEIREKSFRKTFLIWIRKIISHQRIKWKTTSRGLMYLIRTFWPYCKILE